MDATIKESPALSNIGETVLRLAKLSPIEYDQVREDEAKKMGVRVCTLDREVTGARESENDDRPFKNIEPHSDPIDPIQLLDETSETIRRFIVLDKYQSDIAALWISVCWFADRVRIAPIALINAPEKACGKTQLLTVLRKIAPRAEQFAGISPSVLFRMIEKYQPTLFIDEIETVLKDNEPLRGLLNAGHTRDSANVWRSVSAGDDFELKKFNVWGMKAIAGINAIRLAETITSRSIVFELRRKKPDEEITRLRYAEPGLFETLQAKFARFAKDYADKVQQVQPYLPDELGDREQDNIEPLLQVAHVAGGHWPGTALDAALKMCKTTDSHHNKATELLCDIRDIFETKKDDKISTDDLIKMLASDNEKPWQTYNNGGPLTPRQLASILKPYRISSKKIRAGCVTLQGYELNQFQDTFDRYLSNTPAFYPEQRNNSLKANNHAASHVPDSVPEENAKRNNGTNIPDSVLSKYFSPHPLYELRQRVKAMASVADSGNVPDCSGTQNQNGTLQPASVLGCSTVPDKIQCEQVA